MDDRCGTIRLRLVDPLDRSLAGSPSTSTDVGTPRTAVLGAASGHRRRPSISFRLLRHAPAEQQLPVLLFACTHHLLLDEPDSELAQWYPNLTHRPPLPDDPELMPTFRRFVDGHE